MRSIGYATVLFFLAPPAFGQPPERVSDVVMATVRLMNPKSAATGFILVRPKKKGDQPGRLATLAALLIS